MEEGGQVDEDALGQGAPQRRAGHRVVGGRGGEQQWDGGSRFEEAGVTRRVEQEMTNKYDILHNEFTDIYY